MMSYVQSSKLLIPHKNSRKNHDDVITDKYLNRLNYNHLDDRMAISKFEIYEDKSEGFRFRLKAPNGEIIATSESYTSKASCMNGIESVRKNAPVAQIVEIE